MADLAEAPIRTVQQNALPGERVDSSAPISSFGGGDGLTQSMNASQNVAGQAQELADKELQRQNQIAHAGSVAAMTDLKTQTELQIKNMKGADAAAAPDVAQKTWQDGIQKIRDGLSNGAQKQAFDRSAASGWEGLNRTVQFHVNDQMVANDVATTSAVIDNAKANAALNYDDPKSVQDNVDAAKAALTDHANRMGIHPTNADGTPNPLFEDTMRKSISPIYADVIQAHIDNGNTDGAKDMLEQAKAYMTPQDQLRLSKSLEMGKDIQLGNEIWGDVQGFKLADGRTPDLGKMEANISDRDDISDEKKQRMINFIRGKAGDAERQINMRDQANNTAFQNFAVKAKQSGATLEQALQGVTQFSSGPADQAAKEAAVQKMYAPPDETDIHTKVALWTGIEEGHTNVDDINRAFQQGKVNDKDYFTLMTEAHKANVEGRTPQMKAINSSIRQDATTAFGNDKEKIDAFIDAVNAKAMGKAPEEKAKIAKDELKTAPGTGFFGTDWFAKQQYDLDHQQDQASTLAIGKANEDLGDDTVRSLKAGAAFKGTKFDPGYLESLSQQVGGYENLKPNAPGGQAIKILQNAGRPVTPANIQALFDHGIVKNPNAAPAPTQAAPAAPAAPAPVTKTTQAEKATGKKSGLDKFKEDFSPSDYTKNVAKGLLNMDGS